MWGSVQGAQLCAGGWGMWRKFQMGFEREWVGPSLERWRWWEGGGVDLVINSLAAYAAWLKFRRA